jgi:uncharacterized membrane protein (DUF373 family)
MPYLFLSVYVCFSVLAIEAKQLTAKDFWPFLEKLPGHRNALLASHVLTKADGDLSMLAYLKRFERLIAWVLVVLLVCVILLATVDLAVSLIKEVLFVKPHFLVGVDQLLQLFGFFLVIVLGLELLESISTYLREDLIHVEVVLIVAIIALARKVVILELKEPTPLALLGLATLVIALSVSYWLIMRVMRGNMDSSASRKR